MPISVTSKIYTYANGSANDGSQVDTEFAALYNNDTTLANTLNTQAAQISALQSFQIPTATVLPLMSSILPTGWLYLDGRTIGNASSGGTARANLDVQNLYIILWNGTNDTQCPVTSGRGLNATAD
ncbi:MAG: hypothetical protein K2X66_07860, partial [Cyanobacteria bacterium]|nr:hypothetical protein [Cyanobacteriota bacterium]